MKNTLTTLLSATAIALTAQNLVAHYPLNGNGNDLSGNNKNGVVTNVMTTVDRNNNATSAMNYNGTTSKIEVTDTTGFNNGNGSISVAAWFKNESLSGINPIFTTGMQGFASGIYLCCNYLSANGKVVFALASSTTGYPAGVPGTIFIQSNLSTYNDNKWHHVVVVVDKTLNIATMYIDGAKASIQKYNGLGVTGGTIQNNNTELNITGLSSTSRPSQAYVGVGVASGANQFWKGDLDEVYYFKKALTETEIQNLYNGVSVSLNKYQKNSNVINLYPNPAFNVIHLKNGSLADGTLATVSDAQGKFCFETTTFDSKINISDLNPGLYILTLSDIQGNTSTHKFIKE